MTNKNTVFSAQIPENVSFNVFMGRKIYFRTNKLEKAYAFNLEKIHEFLSQKFTVKFFKLSDTHARMHWKIFNPNGTSFFAEIEFPKDKESKELSKLLKVRSKECKAYKEAELYSTEYEFSKLDYKKFSGAILELVSEIFRREFTEDEKLLVKKLIFLTMNKFNQDYYLKDLKEDFKAISSEISKESFTEETLPKFYFGKIGYITKYLVDPIKEIELFYNPKPGFKKRYVIVTSVSGERCIFEKGENNFDIF